MNFDIPFPILVLIFVVTLLWAYGLTEANIRKPSYKILNIFLDLNLISVIVYGIIIILVDLDIFDYWAIPLTLIPTINLILIVSSGLVAFLSIVIATIQHHLKAKYFTIANLVISFLYSIICLGLIKFPY